MKVLGFPVEQKLQVVSPGIGTWGRDHATEALRFSRVDSLLVACHLSVSETSEAQICEQGLSVMLR